MKLYTEEQVKKIAKLYRYELYLLEPAIKTEKPIELPSDEEIGQEFKYYSENSELRQSLEVGAKWMRDKIQGGDK